MTHTQTAIHNPVPADVSVTCFEVSREHGPAPRRSVHLTSRGSVVVYGDPAELLDYFKAVVAKLAETIEVVEPEPEVPAAPMALLTKAEVIERLRTEYGRQFPDANEFSSGSVDYERRKMLDELERLDMRVVDVHDHPEGLPGDRSFTLAQQVTVHTLSGPDLIIDTEGVIAGGDRAMVVGRIVRTVTPDDDPADLPSSFVFAAPAETAADEDIEDRDEMVKAWERATPADVAAQPFEEEGGTTDA